VSRVVVFLEESARQAINNRISVTAKKKTEYEGEEGVHALVGSKVNPFSSDLLYSIPLLLTGNK
jgi:hypothetical protein